MNELSSNAANASQLPPSEAPPTAAPSLPVAPKVYNEPPVLFDQTQTLIAEVEKRLDGPLITYWTNSNGSVCGNDVVAINELLQNVGQTQRLYLFIKSDGGNGRASLRIVNLLRQYCKELIALVPLNCESAATMLVLGADEIHMGPIAYLTAVDTFITHDLSPVDKDNDRVRIGTNEMERVLRLWKQEGASKEKNPYEEVYRYIHPVVLAAVDRAGSLSRMLCEEILGYHMKDEVRRREISERLNSHYPSHSYPIMLPEATRIGLRAVKLDQEINRLLVDLNGLYSEMGQHCRTDFDQYHYHDNEIVNILEAASTQVYYHVDKDWHFRQVDRTWVWTNEKSSYRVRRRTGDITTDEKLHIR